MTEKPTEKPTQKPTHPMTATTAKTYSYDGERYATLCDGTVIQIDPQDAHLLDFGKWRHLQDRKRVCAYKPVLVDPNATDYKTKYKKVYKLLGHEILNNPDALLTFANGNHLDYRRSNLVNLKTPCPFSEQRLRELYQDSLMSRRQIADLARPLCCQKVTAQDVGKWLRCAQVPVRSRVQQGRITSKMPSVKENLKKARLVYAEMSRAGTLRVGKMDLFKYRLKAKRTQKTKRAANLDKIFPLYKCALCGKSFRRSKSQVEWRESKGRKNVFCSLRCSARFGNLFRKQKNVGSPDWLQSAITDARETVAANTPERLRKLREAGLDA